MSTEQDTQELFIDSEKETQILEVLTEETKTSLNSKQETLDEKVETGHDKTMGDDQHNTEICSELNNQAETSIRELSNQFETPIGELSNQTETLMDVDECGLWEDKRLREEKRLNSSKQTLTQQEYIDMFLEGCRKAS